MLVPITDTDINSQVYLHLFVEDIEKYDSFNITISAYDDMYSAIISINNGIGRGYFYNRLCVPNHMISIEYPEYSYNPVSEYNDKGEAIRKKYVKCKKPNLNTLYYSRYAIIKRYRKMCEIYNTYAGEFPQGKKEIYI